MKKSFKFFIFTLFFICSLCILSNSTFQNNEYLSYAEEQQTIGTSAKAQLNTNAQNLYNYISEKVSLIANGDLESTVFSIPENTLSSWGIKTKWTNTEIGKTKITLDDTFPLFIEQFEISKMLSAILHDHPYEMYWFDKTNGLSESVSASTNAAKTFVEINSFEILFAVSQEYQPANYNYKNPTIDITKTSSAIISLNNAKQIVEDYKLLGDYQKIIAYKSKICDLVSYNQQAADDPYTPYGNPWQLIFVFDNNPSTNVVCEGYAKAFQLLCNLSTFESPFVKCYTISGNMNDGINGGAHMWNIVTMEDELTYLVDITNSDSGTVGQSGTLFLQGSNSGNITSGYVFNTPSPIIFSYNTNVLDLWGQSSNSILALNSHDYEVEHPTISINAQNIVYDNNHITAGLLNTGSFDVSYTFEETKWNASNYNWSHEWFLDKNNAPGSALNNPPMSAGYYWIKVTAINKIDNSIHYVHSQKFQINPSEVTISSVTCIGKVYDGTQIVSVTGVVLSGVFAGDIVELNTSLIAKTNSSNVGTYTSVNLSNLSLLGEDKNNYFISQTITEVPSNSFEITKATLSFEETFTEITQENVTLADLEITIKASGALGENVDGTFVWTTEDGTLIDTSATKIEKNKTYYYEFTPTNSNYQKTISSVVLWDTNKDSNTNLFSKENLPKLIEYSLYIILGAVILVCVASTLRKKYQNKTN